MIPSAQYVALSLAVLICLGCAQSRGAEEPLRTHSGQNPLNPDDFTDEQLAGLASLKSRMLCAGIFVSNREAADVLAADLPDRDAIEHTIDYGNQTVTAAVAGRGTRTAVKIPGNACAIALGESPIESQRRLGVMTSPSSVEVRALDSAPPVGFDTEKLDEAIAKTFSEVNTPTRRATRGIVVLHHGKIVAERYADGFDKDTALISYSMAKTVTAVIAGLLHDHGQIDLASPIGSSSWPVGDARRVISLDHLLRMTSGLKFEEVYEPLTDAARMLFSAKDSADFAARQPLQYSPGEHWAYSTGSTQMIMRALKESFMGDDTAYRAFPRRALFDPIGMHSAVFDIDPSGTLIGGMAMYATPRDFARFGVLLLQDGVWQGKRILSNEWLAYMRRPTPENKDRRVGAHIWINGLSPEGKRWWPHLPDDTFAALGFREQSLTIIPSLDLVIVRMANGERRGASLEFDGDVVSALRVGP